MRRICAREYFDGEFQLPGDKSITHRAVMLNGGASGEAMIENARIFNTQSIIEKHLLYLYYIIGQGVDKLVPILGFRTDNPQHKLMLGHFVYVLMHPSGNAAVDKRIAAFQNQTDPHSLLLFKCNVNGIRCCTKQIKSTRQTGEFTTGNTFW